MQKLDSSTALSEQKAVAQLMPSKPTRVTIETYVIRAIAVGMSVFHLYTAYAGTLYPFAQRGTSLLFATALAFLTIRAGTSASTDGRIPVYDWLLALLAVPAIGYVAFNSDYLANRWPMTEAFAPTAVQIVLGVLAVLLILEAARRVMGWVLVIGAGLALLYCNLGDQIPIPYLEHRGFAWRQILDYMYMTQDGLWGSALGIAATYIVLFIIFGAFAERAGAADFFIQFANSLAGHTRGGPAKVAAVSSGLLGSVTGSTVANVYTTGQFTIPMMKRLGYRPSIAGAVEALASNGGQIMPPVLGAAAFILAASIGLPYYELVIASIAPAFLYYSGLFLFIHLEAHRAGLRGIPRAEKPPVLATLLKGGHLLLPLVALIVLLNAGHSPIRAAFYVILFTVALSWIRKETRLGPKELIEALEVGAKNSVMIVVTCAVIGFIIGAFTLSGLGLNATSGIIGLAGGNFLLLLILIGLSCILLGMGMNTVAAFILASIIGVPALTAHGVDPLPANMFVFYFALLSHITPPICLGIYAAAGIAGANVWETAFYGMKMGLVAYLLPFLVVFSPALLLVGSPQTLAVDIGSTYAGAALLIVCVQGRLFDRQSLPERILSMIAGAALIWPDGELKAVGAVLGLAIVVVSALLYRKRQSLTVAPQVRSE